MARRWVVGAVKGAENEHKLRHGFHFLSIYGYSAPLESPRAWGVKEPKGVIAKGRMVTVITWCWVRGVRVGSFCMF